MATSLELAITAIRSGRKEEGRQLLNLLIQQNPNDEMAWLWMSSVVNTDEQRARCLYHVLAINPDSNIARRGLEVLGIVVSDSRPVKIPRDSQPIQTQRTGAPFPEPPSPSRPVPVEERRPFRIDSKTITRELPFTPVRDPFAAPQQSASSNLLAASDQSAEPPLAISSTPARQLQHPSKPTSVVSENASKDMAPPPGGQPQHALEPAPVTASPGVMPPPQPQAAGPGQIASEQQHNAALAATQKLAGPQQSPPDSAPVPVSAPPDSSPVPPTQPPSAQFPQLPAGGSNMDTRPSQPVPVTHANATMGMPMQNNQGQPPAELAPAAAHSYATMGMPMPYVQPQNPWQSAPAYHSNPTMGMPSPMQPGQGNGQSPHPSEPVPVVHSNVTQGMPSYAQPQFQQAWPQNPAFYSNATMAMPMPPYAMQQANNDPAAAFRAQPGMMDYRVANRTARGAKKNENEDEDEVNILAVIIFGSLSVTALGGLGMLILLMFTGG